MPLVSAKAKLQILRFDIIKNPDSYSLTWPLRYFCGQESDDHHRQELYHSSSQTQTVHRGSVLVFVQEDEQGLLEQTNLLAELKLQIGQGEI